MHNSVYMLGLENCAACTIWCQHSHANLSRTTIRSVLLKDLAVCGWDYAQRAAAQKKGHVIAYVDRTNEGYACEHDRKRATDD